jgi:hypothetical protein
VSAFKEFLTRLVRVPKHEIEEQDRTFRKQREADEYKGQRRPVVPTISKQAGRKHRPPS